MGLKTARLRWAEEQGAGSDCLQRVAPPVMNLGPKHAKRLQLSIHCKHSVKNEAVMQAGTQSTRERKTQASLGSGQKTARLEAQGFYSIGGRIPFLQ